MSTSYNMEESFIKDAVKPVLDSSPDDILFKFKFLKCFEDVASLLEIPTQFLWKVLIRDKTINYKSFVLKKKSGGYRTIYSPSRNLAILQKKLAYILSLNFVPHDRAHGFIRNRSIVTNASEHVRKNIVLNLDLDNFFESITFGRVRNMFISYFKLNKVIATTLANICVHPDGFLPQGGATSPIISNILAKSLDRELKKLAIDNMGAKYTRYADDITFSTNKSIFPKDIAFVDENGHVFLSDQLKRIIEKNGFIINEKKTRFQDSRSSQSVTGIIVNEKLNLKRTYIRRIRSILNCIEKNITNIDYAREIFKSKYPFRQTLADNDPDMFAIVKGMISHVGHVKGRQDPVYLKLANRFNQIVSSEELIIKSVEEQNLKRNFYENYTYVIDHDKAIIAFIPGDDTYSEIYHNQGTGFLLKDIGIVTNAHVIKEVIDAIDLDAQFQKECYLQAFNSNSSKIYNMKIEYYDVQRDIAILSSEDINHCDEGFSYNGLIEKGLLIDLLGYPDYKKGQEIRVQNGFVQGIRMHQDSNNKHVRHKRYEITPMIYGGNSGGPVVNRNNEVVAIAVKGATMNGVVPNEVIPISEIVDLAKKNGLFNDSK